MFNEVRYYFENDFVNKFIYYLRQASVYSLMFSILLRTWSYKIMLLPFMDLTFQDALKIYKIQEAQYFQNNKCKWAETPIHYTDQLCEELIHFFAELGKSMDYTDFEYLIDKSVYGDGGFVYNFNGDISVQLASRSWHIVRPSIHPYRCIPHVY